MIRQDWRALRALLAGPVLTTRADWPMWAASYAELVARGWAERRARGRWIRITPAGRAALREVGQWRV